MSALRKSKRLMEELTFMLKHVDRKSNELIYMKCVNPRCNHCSQNLIIATDAWEDLKEIEFKWHNPAVSTKFPGHYILTSLESLEVGKEMHKAGKFTSTWWRKSDRGKIQNVLWNLIFNFLYLFPLDENFILHLQVMLVCLKVNQSAKSLLSKLVIYVRDRKEEALINISPWQTRYVLYIHFLTASPVILNLQK